MSAVCLKEKELSDPFKLTINQIRAKPLNHRSCYRPDLCLNRWGDDCFYGLQAILASWWTEAECSPDQKVLSSSHSVRVIKQSGIVDRGQAVAVFPSFLLLSSVSAFHRRSRDVNVWFEAVRMCSSMQMDCVRLVEIVYLNSGLSAGFIVSVSSEPVRNRCGFVRFLNVCPVECWDVCRMAHHALAKRSVGALASWVSVCVSIAFWLTMTRPGLGFRHAWLYF